MAESPRNCRTLPTTMTLRPTKPSMIRPEMRGVETGSMVDLRVDVFMCLDGYGRGRDVIYTNIETLLSVSIYEVR